MPSHFSSLFKIPWLFPDWKMPSHFSSPSGNPDCILKPEKSTFALLDTYRKCNLDSSGIYFSPHRYTAALIPGMANTNDTTNSVADPEFSGGGANSQGGCASLLFCNFLPKTARKLKNLDLGWAVRPLGAFGSINGIVHFCIQTLSVGIWSALLSSKCKFSHTQTDLLVRSTVVSEEYDWFLWTFRPY